MRQKDDLGLHFNVRITARENGKLIRSSTRESHNVFVNGGRAWVTQILGSSDYGQTPPTAHIRSKIKYIGFGCGGALQSDNQFANTRTEIVSVDALEDAIPYSVTGGVSTFLKAVANQAQDTISFPDSYRARFIVTVLESEISYVGSTTRISLREPGLSVPVSECGLYLSSAAPTFTTGGGGLGSEADPSSANGLVAYNTFEPIPVTPNTVLRAIWELRQ
tara:strand:+ start:131 stop:790 length:660 start_codon:yes stop_codon:yes gene_type:complete